MNDSQTARMHEILATIDQDLRRRLKSAGLNVEHVILAIVPGGGGVLRSNVGAHGLGEMAELLADVAEGVALDRPDNATLH